MNDSTITDPNTSDPTQIKTGLHRVLNEEFGEGNFDLVDVVPIPKTGDRSVRLRTLEEVLEEFDRTEKQELMGYIVQLRPAFLRKKEEAETTPPSGKKPAEVNAPAPESVAAGASATASSAMTAAHPSKPTLDGIYLPNGKLNVQYLIRNAEVLAEAGDYAPARTVFRTVVQSGELVWRALLGMARCFEREGKWDEAQAHFEESIAFHPTFEAYTSLAALLSRQKKDLLAAEVLGRAQYLKGITPEQRYEIIKNCGNAWIRAGQAGKSEALFLRALEIQPGSQEVREFLADFYRESDRIEEAMERYQECLALNPKHARAHYGLGLCHLSQDRKRDAHDCFARSLDLELNHPAAVYQLVKCAYEIKSYVTAARIVEEYVDVAPVNANLLYSLAGLQFHLNRLVDAATTARRVLEIAPQHTGARDLLGLIMKNARSVQSAQTPASNGPGLR